MHRILLVLALLALVCGSGCSARRCGDLPRVDSKTIVPPKVDPSVDFEARYNRLSDMAHQTKWLKGHVDKAFHESGFFSRVSHSEGAGEYHFSVRYIDEELRPEKSPDAILACLTLGLIPIKHKGEVTLRVEVSRKGMLLRTYVYRENVEVFCWTLIGSAGAAYQSQAVANEVIDDMLRSLLADLSRDRLLEAPTSTAAQ